MYIIIIIVNAAVAMLTRGGGRGPIFEWIVERQTAFDCCCRIELYTHGRLRSHCLLGRRRRLLITMSHSQNLTIYHAVNLFLSFPPTNNTLVRRHVDKYVMWLAPVTQSHPTHHPLYNRRAQLSNWNNSNSSSAPRSSATEVFNQRARNERIITAQWWCGAATGHGMLMEHFVLAKKVTTANLITVVETNLQLSSILWKFGALALYTGLSLSVISVAVVVGGGGLWWLTTIRAARIAPRTDYNLHSYRIQIWASEKWKQMHFWQTK